MDLEQKGPGPRAVPPHSEYESLAAGDLPPGQVALAKTIHEKFLQTFSEELSQGLRAPLSIQLSSTGTCSAAAFLDSREEGGCLLALETEPVQGHAFVVLSAGLVAYLLRVLLGAPSASETSRAATEIEMHILREIFEMLAKELSDAWQCGGVRFRWMSTGVSKVADVAGSVLVFECRVNLEDGPQTFEVAIPGLLTRLAVMHSIPTAPKEEQAAVRATILSALRRSNVTAEAVLSGSKLRMGDLLAMEPGHLLMLTQAAGSPIELRINGKAKFLGEWICRENRQAIELL